MSTKPTPADAELILKLYDLRREAEMRKARNWWVGAFWPQNADEVAKIASALGTQENNWLRQVGGYWEMAASLVLHGALNEDLFLEGSFSGEMFFIFAKVRPFLKELREKMQAPKLFGNVEKLINNSQKGRDILKTVKDNLPFAQDEECHRYFSTSPTGQRPHLVCIPVEIMGGHDKGILQAMRHEQRARLEDITLFHD